METKYTLNQVAVMTGLSTRTLRNYLKSGLVNAEKTDGVWLFSVENFESLLTTPAVKSSIRAKNKSVIYDFIADNRKKENKICTVLDIRCDDDEGQEISQFFCDTINGSYSEPDIIFKFEKYGNNVRIILSGGEEIVSDLLNRYYCN